MTQAVEAGLSSHNRIENAQARPNAGGQMKAAYEIGLAREAFAQQRGALETLADVAFERLKQAADLIAEHARAVAAAIRLRADAVGSAEPQPPSPPSPSPQRSQPVSNGAEGPPSDLRAFGTPQWDARFAHEAGVGRRAWRT